MDKNYTMQIVNLIEQICKEEIPSDVYNLAKDSVLDFLGVAYAGAQECEPTLKRYLEVVKTNKGSCTVIGIGNEFSPYDASLLNGISAHYFELDDGSRFGMVHIGAVVFPTLFAGAQLRTMTGKDFLKGTIIGYEIAVRLSAAVQPSHKKKGYHTTGTCGCIGAAVALAIAWKYDTDQICSTISAAATSAAGLLEVIDDASQLKPFNAGRAAQAAVTAAMIGRADICGPNDVLGGKRGFFAVMAGSLNEEWFEHSGEKEYAIRSIYRKPYASCRHCHSAVEAALHIREELINELGTESFLEQISNINVQTYGLAVYGHNHTVISGINSAKMSIPYSVAAALILNDGGMEAVSLQAISNQKILKLASCVQVTEVESYSIQVPNKRIAKVMVTLQNGSTYAYEVTYPKGEPENPITSDELQRKFRKMAIYGGRSEEYCNSIIYYVENIENNLQRLLDIL